MQNYNLIQNTKDISEESGPVTEPVTLQEMKNYLRLEGLLVDNEQTSLTMQEPLALVLDEDATTVQDDSLIDAVITTLSRSGVTYTQDVAVGNLKFTHNPTTGVVAFQTAGNAGGEDIAVSYGLNLANGSDDDFTFDDDLIEELITNARETLEEELNCSIVNHTWEARGVTNLAGMVQLKYGPITELIEVRDSEDDELDITDTGIVKMIGDNLKIPRQCDMTIQYTAGFDRVPKAIITEIKRMVAYLYDNRGDTDGLKGYQYTANVLKYSRKAWLE